MIKHLRLKAYGKINLALDVLGRWADGYHEVQMIMQTMKLHGRVDLYVTQKPDTKIKTNLFYLLDNKQNLAHKAVRPLMEEFGIRQGLSIHPRKFVPMSAGMTGGSTDAASVLFGVNKMFDLGLSAGELVERGVTLEADIPYCLMRGTTLSEGVGKRLSPLPPMPQCQMLVARLGISVSTRVIYESLDAMKLAPSDHPDVDGMIGTIRSQNLREVASRFGNVLELVAGERCLAISRIEQVMRDYEALGAMMSGSDPAVFGLFTNPRATQAAYEDLRFGKASELIKQVYLTDFFNVRKDGQDMA